MKEIIKIVLIVMIILIFSLLHLDIRKVQIVRILDVFFLGPLKIYVSIIPTNIPILIKLIMFISGIGTIKFNGSNLLKDPLK